MTKILTNEQVNKLIELDSKVKLAELALKQLKAEYNIDEVELNKYISDKGYVSVNESTRTIVDYKQFAADNPKIDFTRYEKHQTVRSVIIKNLTA